MQIDCYGFEASSQWFRRKELEVYLMKEVEGILYLCYGNQAECERKAKELAEKYKAAFAARETAAGTMVFEVNYGTKSVEVSLASAAHSRLSAKAAADW